MYHFLDATYKLYHMIFVFLCLTYFTLYDNPLGPSMLLQMAWFILFYGWVIFHCMYHIFIHSSVGEHLGCFHVLAIVNSTAVNTGVHVRGRVIPMADSNKFIVSNRNVKKKSKWIWVWVWILSPSLLREWHVVPVFGPLNSTLENWMVYIILK